MENTIYRMSDIIPFGKINLITAENSTMKIIKIENLYIRKRRSIKNMNKNNQEVNQSCLNCMYEYVCDWKYTNEELSCDKWQSDKDGNLSNKRIRIR